MTDDTTSGHNYCGDCGGRVHTEITMLHGEITQIYAECWNCGLAGTANFGEWSE